MNLSKGSPNSSPNSSSHVRHEATPAYFQDEGVTFTLQLNCLSRKSSETKVLKLNSLPSTVMEIKRVIEEEFSIPTCVQTLTYQCATIEDDKIFLDASFRHIRSGDSLSVEYTCEADIKKINEIVDWIKRVTEAILDEMNSQQVINALIHQGDINKYDVVLSLEIFDWLDAKTHMNKIYFNESGGIKALLDLYNHILKQRWNDIPQTYKYLECLCLHAFANYGETFYFRRILVSHNVLEMAMKSMMRVKLKITDGKVWDENNSCLGAGYDSYAVKSVLDYALHTICNFSELPECQLTIASSSSIIYQSLCLSLSDFFYVSLSVLVAELFLCLAHSSDTHVFLAKPWVIETLIMVCSKWRVSSASSRKDHLLILALRCFTLMVYAQIGLVSPHLLPAQYIPIIIAQTKVFLSTAKPQDIKEYEEEQVCVWATLLPYLKLIFLPSSKSNVPTQRQHEASNIDFIDTRKSTFSSLTQEKLEHQVQGDGDRDVSDMKIVSPSSGNNHSTYPPLSSSENMSTSNDSIETRELSLTDENYDSLQRVCLDMVLYFLHTKVTRKYHCNILMEENLIDFFTCLPWHIKTRSKQKAIDLVTELRTHVQLQPPKLSNLAKAVLATMHFGLEKVVGVFSPMELAREMLEIQ